MPANDGLVKVKATRSFIGEVTLKEGETTRVNEKLAKSLHEFGYVEYVDGKPATKTAKEVK